MVNCYDQHCRDTQCGLRVVGVLGSAQVVADGQAVTHPELRNPGTLISKESLRELAVTYQERGNRGGSGGSFEQLLTLLP
jgi:hypothetical protein